jgi:cell fate regulator YaaT (PSP1 superfamily)
MQSYFVRIGSLAEVSVAFGSAAYCRDDRVIVRTDSGLQLGHVIGPCREPASADSNQIRILRRTNDDDDLLIRRLNRHKRTAIERCRERLRESGSDCVLLDVEQMLDGQTLVMHFLGEVDQTAQRISQEIVEQYESVVRTRHFAKLLREGCGPECGTNGNCATGGCAGCDGAGCSRSQAG